MKQTYYNYYLNVAVESFVYKLVGTLPPGASECQWSMAAQCFPPHRSVVPRLQALREIVSQYVWTNSLVAGVNESVVRQAYCVFQDKLTVYKSTPRRAYVRVINCSRSRKPVCSCKCGFKNDMNAMPISEVQKCYWVPSTNTFWGNTFIGFYWPSKIITLSSAWVRVLQSEK